MSCYEGDVEEGDIIYYPADWWHQTTIGEGGGGGGGGGEELATQFLAPPTC